jgi:hypothetical protein
METNRLNGREALAALGALEAGGLARTIVPGGRIWFSAAHTKFGLEAAAEHAPAVDHFFLRIPVPNRRIVADRLKHLGVEAAPPVDDGLLSFRDPNGFTVELAGQIANK